MSAISPYPKSVTRHPLKWHSEQKKYSVLRCNPAHSAHTQRIREQIEIYLSRSMTCVVPLISLSPQ
jgi:hypothetical protein